MLTFNFCELLFIGQKILMTEIYKKFEAGILGGIEYDWKALLTQKAQ